MDKQTSPNLDPTHGLALQKSKKRISKKSVLIKTILAVFIVLASATGTILIARIIRDSPKNTVDQSTLPPLRANVDEKRNFEKDSTAMFGYFEVKINKVTANYIPEGDLLPTKDGYTFLLLNMTAKNTDAESHLLSDIDLGILDGEEVLNASFFVQVKPAIQGEVVEPAKSITGNLVYEVPANAKDLKLYYNKSLFNDEAGRLKKIEYTLPF